MDVILKTENLTKRYGSKIAANAVNMTVERGDIYGFIGKNGAGKTTVMRMILGTTFPDEGKIELFGGENLQKARYKIGSLVEAPGFFRNCSAKENMHRFSILCGGDDKEIDDILALVGLADTGKKKAGAFSLGMKQRLGIAIALLGKPEFMVLDEPINGLDPEGIKSIRDLVLYLNREKGITFLISSHLLDELAKIVTKFGIINEGVLIDEVRAQELKSRTLDGLKIVADDNNKAIEVLKKFAAPEKIVTDDGYIMMHEGFEDAAAINAALVKAGVRVSEISMHSNGLEEYFIARIGK